MGFFCPILHHGHVTYQKMIKLTWSGMHHLSSNASLQTINTFLSYYSCDAQHRGLNLSRCLRLWTECGYQSSQLLPPRWWAVTLLNCRNLFLHDSTLGCIASYHKSVCHFRIHMRLSQVCFLPSAVCGDLSLQLGDVLSVLIYVSYILLFFWLLLSCRKDYFPVVPVNPCWNCKASVLPYDPWHLISERSALKQAFHLALKLALQHNKLVKIDFSKRGFVLSLYSFLSTKQNPFQRPAKGQNTLLFAIISFGKRTTMLCSQEIQDFTNFGSSY